MLCDDPQGWDWGWGGRLRGRDYIRMLMADLHCCKAETTPLCKAIILQLKIKFFKNGQVSSNTEKPQSYMTTDKLDKNIFNILLLFIILYRGIFFK